MRAFTAKIRNLARKNAPKRTGKLRKSIVNKVSMRSDGRVIGTVIISPKRHGVMYGHWVEWGRQYPPQGGQHFMTRAFEAFNSKQLFADEVSIAYDSYLAKMVGKHR